MNTLKKTEGQKNLFAYAAGKFVGILVPPPPERGKGKDKS